VIVGSELYKETRAGALVGIYQKVKSAMEAQARDMEEYPNSPYTREKAELIGQSASALRIIGEELRAWHRFNNERAGE
jgi:hypothetical protein